MYTTLTVDTANPFIGIKDVLLKPDFISRVRGCLESITSDGIYVMLENQELKFIPYDLENAILDLQPGKEIAIITDHKNLFKVDNEEEKHYIDIIEKGKYKQTIKGYIVDSDTNGLIAKVNNIKGLIPNYLINSETELDINDYIGETLDLKLVNLKIKLSKCVRFMPIYVYLNKQTLEHYEAYEKFIEKHKVNDIVKCKVISIQKYNVVVLLEKDVLGFINISNLTWRNVSHPSQVVKKGDVISCVILTIEGILTANKQITLGYKQLQKRPFEKLNRRLKVGKITNGRVSSINRFGLVIQLDCGAEGFVYLEELDYDSSVKVEHFNINERVNVLIIGIDPSQERIDLSIKRTQKDPWLEIDRYVTVGRNEEAIVSKILYNGIVIEIRNKIKGILYLSNMRPIIDDTEIKNKFQEGDYVYVTITGINKRKKELKLRQVSL